MLTWIDIAIDSAKCSQIVEMARSFKNVKIARVQSIKSIRRQNMARQSKLSSGRTAVVVTSSTRRRKQYGQVGPEMKYFDSVAVADATTTPDENGFVVSLNTIDQGVTAVTRIGNKVQNKSVEIKGSVNAIYASSGPYQFRWAVVLDKEPQANAIAAYTDIYTRPGTGMNLINGFRNNGESDRFVVLATDTFTQVSGNDSQLVSFERFIPVDIATKYIASGVGQASFGTNQLLFTMICVGNTQPTTGDVLANVTARVRFTDE